MDWLPLGLMDRLVGGLTIRLGFRPFAQRLRQLDRLHYDFTLRLPYIHDDSPLG
jgi:hypothetical protein